MQRTSPKPIVVEQGSLRLPALLRVPDHAKGLVIFAHGSGSGRNSPRNNQVAEALADAGFASLLLDLLMPEEEADRRNVFDIALLARRLVAAIEWSTSQPDLRQLPVALFGASTGAAAALVAAAAESGRVRTVVSRGGRPDLAAPVLPAVRAPTLLLVGGEDDMVLALNEKAYSQLGCEKSLVIVPRAGHLFEEPGTMQAVVAHAIRWLEDHLDHKLGAIA